MKRTYVCIAGLAALAGAIGCARGGGTPDGDSGADSEPTAEAETAVKDGAEGVVLGPVDGHDLPGTDLDRVTAGDMAPDFTAMSLEGEPVTLSQFRGEKNVVLVFYRGHW